MLEKFKAIFRPRTGIAIFESELRAIKAEVSRISSVETGGDLFGLFTHGGMPVVWFASGPGPRARHLRAEFEQDSHFTSEAQRHLNTKFGIQYVGSWHSHHRLGLREPSRGDRSAMRRYAVRHHRRKSIEIIATIEDDSIQLWPYIYRDVIELQPEIGEFRVLSGESPIRKNHTSIVDCSPGSPKSADALSLPDSPEDDMVDDPEENSSDMAEKAIVFPSALTKEILAIERFASVRNLDVIGGGRVFMIAITPRNWRANEILALAIEYNENTREACLFQANFIDQDRSLNRNIEDLVKNDFGPLWGRPLGRGDLVAIVKAADLWVTRSEEAGDKQFNG